MTIVTTSAEPKELAAASSFHGSRLASDEADSPHKLAPKIKARMFFGYAVEDRTMPPEAVEKLEKALDAAGVRYESETFEGARHGWCVKDHNVYNEPQGERAWSRMLKLFKETLR
jgi:carboxymethylenebutenolidase